MLAASLNDTTADNGDAENRQQSKHKLKTKIKWQTFIVSIAGQSIPASQAWQQTLAKDIQTEQVKENIHFIKEVKNLNTLVSIAEQSIQVFQVWQRTLVKDTQAEREKENIHLHFKLKTMTEEILILDNKCKEIEALIRKNYVDENGQCEPLVDGIVNIEKYLQSKFKILWILKEPYDDVENGLPSGGDWRYIEDFLAVDNFYQHIKQIPTWHPIIYTSYGLLNNFRQYETMDYIRDDESMAEIIRNVAVINVQKLPGFTRTYDYDRIWSAYQKNRDILLKQIDTYNPDIIIGGYTLQLFLDDLGIKNDLKNNGSIDYATKNSKLFIHAYHPAQTQITRDIYVNDIINTAKVWADNRQLFNDLDKIRNKKAEYIKTENFEEAARLADSEKTLLEKINSLHSGQTSETK